jgi:hypothetical protein
MSQKDVVKFLAAVHENPALATRYNERNLSQLLLHASNEGFHFTAAELAEVVGKLEASVILAKDRDPFDGTARLWAEMWGRFHLEYLVDHVVSRHTEDELWALIDQEEPEGA